MTGRTVSEIPVNPDPKVLDAVRRAFGMRRLAFLSPGTGGGIELVALLGEAEPGDRKEGRVVTDLGAAAAVLSAGRPSLFNPGESMPLRTPYSGDGVRSAGAAAVPFGGGVLWVDRADRPVSEDELAGIVEMCSLLEAMSENARERRDEAGRVEYLAGVLEGLRDVLTATSERQCVARLVETAARQTRAATGLAVLMSQDGGGAAVVGAFGAGAARVLGRTFDTAGGLVGLAIRSGVAVPSDFSFTRKMRPVLGRGADIDISEGDGLVVQPMGTPDGPMGALVLARGEFGGQYTAHGVRTLCDCATLLLLRFRMQDRMERDAMIDGLTQLYNRQAFLVRLSETFAFCKRHGHDLCLLMVDADRFKLVNDNHGHLVGDRVLRFITETIRRALRESDMAGRYGGEEFCVLLPHTGTEGAVLVAERIREWCAASPVPLDDGKLTVTVSIGVSRLRREMETPLDLIAAADEALYEAKNTGRNKVVDAG